MPVLVLLNGGPASGKSTVAHLWARERPMTLALDLDRLRSMIADWEDHPIDAGLRTRELALAMIGNQLADDHDVIVPQYLAESAFIDRLADTAATARAPFIEVVLLADPVVAERRFRERAGQAERSGDTRAVHGPLGSRSMSELLEAHRRFIDGRPHAILVEGVDGDIAGTLDRLRSAIAPHLDDS